MILLRKLMLKYNLVLTQRMEYIFLNDTDIGSGGVIVNESDKTIFVFMTYNLHIYIDLIVINIY